MKFLGQGFQKLEHKEDRQMRPNALPHLQAIMKVMPAGASVLGTNDAHSFMEI